MQDLYTENKKMVLSVNDLPTLPTVLDEVTELVQDPSSSTDQVAKVISQDQVLSAKVLKMVNSPIYGFPRRISTIQHALVLLGFNVVRGLIISTSVFDAMAESMMGLWEHSLGCAVACTQIAKVAGFKDPEEYSVAGLLHDLGKVVSVVQLPDVKKQVDELVKQKDMSYYMAEKEVMGFSHDRINAWLSDHWNLPLRLREGLVWHHRPKSAQHFPDMACVVHLGDFMSRVFQVGNSGDDQISYLNRYVFKVLNLNQSGIVKILDELDKEYADLSGFRPD
ncbi:HDOD domain-containing protein [Desulfonatronovibrio magnus]|uniref:HDOD domain-containing protein n=1 Tax=Desulfonatronovibrio magnus TaxID=698827 RepID=UPI000AF5B570|nr:HDOD domain-containing protein [Desulfonatronovibrio magnus]